MGFSCYTKREETMDWVSRFKENDSLWRFNDSKYHVQLSESEFHSDLYMNTDKIVCNVKLLESIVKNVFLVELNKRKISPDWIISFQPYGLPIAYALARVANAKFGYVDTKKNVCNFDINSNDKVIVVSDDVYSGRSIVKTIKAVEKLNGNVLEPIFSIGNFSNAKTIEGRYIKSVINEKGNLYEANNCPMCKQGSIPLLARPNWKRLLNSN